MNDEIVSVKFKNSAKIIETKNGKYVIKKKKNDLKSLYNYLSLRNFNNFPKIVAENDKEYVFEYIETFDIPKYEFGIEFIRTISDLHYKTLFNKEMSRKKYKELYDKIISNIDYLKDYYDNLIIEIDKKVFFSPSEYLIARNYSIILSSLLYAERELNSWYKLVENKNKERVSVLHNNLRSEHFLKGENGYLISFDKSIVDTPILDLYKLYRVEVNNLDFVNILKEYNSKFNLNKEEQKLFLILICIPFKFEKTNNEINNVINAKEIIDYLYKSNYLVKSDVFKIENNEQSN